MNGYSKTPGGDSGKRGYDAPDVPGAHPAAHDAPDDAAYAVPDRADGMQSREPYDPDALDALILACENELLTPPAGFSEQVMSRIKARDKAQNRQFLFYSLRVVAAASIALAIILSGAVRTLGEIEPIKLPSITSESGRFWDKVADWLSQLPVVGTEPASTAPSEGTSGTTSTI